MFVVRMCNNRGCNSVRHHAAWLISFVAQDEKSHTNGLLKEFIRAFGDWTRDPNAKTGLRKLFVKWKGAEPDCVNTEFPFWKKDR